MQETEARAVSMAADARAEEARAAKLAGCLIQVDINTLYVMPVCKEFPCYFTETDLGGVAVG